MASWLTETWYVAALSNELKANEMLTRTILDEQIVLFRAAGEVRALFDRCPHRFAPLHLGRLENGVVTCGYHGLKFDGAGRCVHNPHGDGRVPDAAPLRSYPVREQQGFIWIWTGQNGTGPTGAPPCFEFLDTAVDTATIEGYLPTAANYQLMVDNIIDLSHADFLHPALLGTGGVVSANTPKITTADNRVTCSWNWQGDQAMGLFAPFLPDGGKKSDGWLVVEWEAPARMLISSGASATGVKGEGELVINATHLMTPQDDDNTHYFHRGARNFLTDNVEFTAATREAVRKAFAFEDAPMIEATHRNMRGQEFWALKPWLLAGDGGAVRVRRLLDRMVKDEASRKTGKAPPAALSADR
jgi:vanillate O-demethylase monooxygenase subunit